MGPWEVSPGLVQVSQCLNLVRECDIFLGFLGERFGWVPGLEEGGKDGASISQLEMEAGALEKVEEVMDTAFFYLRNQSLVESLPWAVKKDFITPDVEEDKRLMSLKAKILRSGLEVMEEYPAVWLGLGASGVVGGLEILGEQLVRQVWGAIQRLAPQGQGGAGLEQESRSQAAFRERESKSWVGREDLVEQGLEAAGKGSGVVCVAGPAGVGATALLSKLAYNLARKGGALVLSFVMEASLHPQPSLHYVLSYLLYSLGGHQPGGASDVVTLGAKVRGALEQYCARGAKVVLLLDDLQQLEDWEAGWVPSPVPQSMILIQRAVTGSRLHSILNARGDSREVVVKPLEMKERSVLARAMLERQGRALSETAWAPQLQQLVSKRGASSPSYLALALSKLGRQGRHESLGGTLQALGSTAPALLMELLQEAEEACGMALVHSVLLYTSLAPGGLSRPQLLSLLSLGASLSLGDRTGVEALVAMLEDAQKTIPGGSLPLGQLCICLERLTDFLTQPKGRLQLMTGSPEALVQERVVKPLLPAELTRAHRLLGAVALHQYRRGLSDRATLLALPNHLGAVGETVLLKQVLCTPAFLQANIRAGLGNKLLVHLEGASLKLRSSREKFAKDPLVKEYRTFVVANMQLMMASPSQLPQLMLNQPSDSKLRSSFLAKEWSGPPLLEWCTGPETAKEAADESILVREDGSNPTTCLASSRTLLVTGFTDGSILVSDRLTHQDLFCLVGHSDSIVAVGFLSETVLVTASTDGWLCSWDLEKRFRLKSCKVSQGRLSGLAVRHPLVLTTSWDGSLKVWSRDLENTSKLPTPGGPLNCVLLHPSKDVAVTGGWDSTVRVWDLVTLKQRAVLRGHEASVQAIALTEDATKIVSGGLDGTVKVWDCGNGTEISSFEVGSRLSCLVLGPGDHEVVVGGVGGLVTTWPLSLGRVEARTGPGALLTKLHPDLASVEEPLVEATALGREVTALSMIGPDLFVGLSTGDIQAGALGGSSRAGWKAVEGAVTLLGGRQAYSLQEEEVEDQDDMGFYMFDILDKEAPDWNDEIDKYSMCSSDSSTSCEASARPAEPRVDSILQTTIWVGGGSTVRLASIYKDTVLHTVHLGGLEAGAREVRILTKSGKDFILVFGRCGRICVYFGHPARGGRGDIETIQPLASMQAHVGGVTGVVQLGDLLVTVGEDRKLSCWRMEVGEEVKICHVEVEDGGGVYLNRPVGVVCVPLREKMWLWVGLEDGGLVRQEVKEAVAGEPLKLGPRQEVEAGGRGLLGLSQTGGLVMGQQARGMVALWSAKGSRVGEWSRRSTAALLCKEGEAQRLVLGGQGGLEVLEPGKAACSRVLGGHRGRLAALHGSPGALLSAARDGRVRSWSWGEGEGEGAGLLEEVVGIEDISSDSGNLTDFLVIKSSGRLSWWQWQGGRARCKATAGPLQEVERATAGQATVGFGRHRSLPPVASASLVQDGVVMLVTVDKDSYFSLHKVMLRPEGLELEMVGQVQADFHDYLELKSGAQAGCFTIRYSTARNEFGKVVVDMVSAVSKPNKLFQRIYTEVTPSPGAEKFGVSRVGERIYQVEGDQGVKVILGSAGEVVVEREGRREVRWLHKARVESLVGLGQGLVATAGEDGVVRVWGVEAGERRESKFSGQGAGLTVLTGGRGRMVASDRAGRVYALQIWPRTA